MCRRKLYTSTAFSLAICFRQVSTTIYVPVLPTPALLHVENMMMTVSIAKELDKSLEF